MNYSWNIEKFNNKFDESIQDLTYNKINIIDDLFRNGELSLESYSYLKEYKDFKVFYVPNTVYDLDCFKKPYEIYVRQFGDNYRTKGYKAEYFVNILFGRFGIDYPNWAFNRCFKKKKLYDTPDLRTLQLNIGVKNCSLNKNNNTFLTELTGHRIKKTNNSDEVLILNYEINLNSMFIKKYSLKGKGSFFILLGVFLKEFAKYNKDENINKPCLANCLYETVIPFDTYISKCLRRSEIMLKLLPLYSKDNVDRELGILLMGDIVRKLNPNGKFFIKEEKNSTHWLNDTKLGNINSFKKNPIPFEKYNITESNGVEYYCIFPTQNKKDVYYIGKSIKKRERCRPPYNLFFEEKSKEAIIEDFKNLEGQEIYVISYGFIPILKLDDFSNISLKIHYVELLDFIPLLLSSSEYKNFQDDFYNKSMPYYEYDVYSHFIEAIHMLSASVYDVGNCLKCFKDDVRGFFDKCSTFTDSSVIFCIVYLFEMLLILKKDDFNFFIDSSKGLQRNESSEISSEVKRYIENQENVLNKVDEDEKKKETLKNNRKTFLSVINDEYGYIEMDRVEELSNKHLEYIGKEKKVPVEYFITLIVNRYFREKPDIYAIFNECYSKE